MKRTILIAAVVFVLLSVYGCSLKTGKPIPGEQVQAITPGKTTKDELFTRFGLPAAIMGRGEIAVVNTPAVWSGMMENRYTYSFSSDTFFELFPAEGAPDEYRRVYYFCRTVSYKYPVWYILYFGQNGKTKTDRLWVLVNEKTGLVEDYAFRKYGESVIFGRSRGVHREQIIPR